MPTVDLRKRSNHSHITSRNARNTKGGSSRFMHAYSGTVTTVLYPLSDRPSVIIVSGAAAPQQVITARS